VTHAIDEQRIMSIIRITKSSKRATMRFAIVMMINTSWNFQYCRNTVICWFVRQCKRVKICLSRFNCVIYVTPKFTLFYVRVLCIFWILNKTTKAPDHPI